MKYILTVLLCGVCAWLGAAYQASITPPPIVRIYKAERSEFVVPAHECARTCRARAKAALTK